MTDDYSKVLPIKQSTLSDVSKFKRALFSGFGWVKKLTLLFSKDALIDRKVKVFTITNKCCYFKPSIHQTILKKKKKRKVHKFLFAQNCFIIIVSEGSW